MRTTSLKKPMMISKDAWVTTALKDDDMVVELLLRLKHAGIVDSVKNHAANLPLLRWGFRQRRSRPSRFGVGVGGFLKKEMDSARASPTTPLCWSGGSGSGGSSTSLSAATVDCFEDNSRQASCSTSTGSGSKVLHATTYEISSSCSKRLSKKKTFLELKDSENLQLKERLHLKKKIANVEAMYKQRRAKNRSLKRIKLEYSDRVKNIPISKSNLDESRREKRLPSSISMVKKEQHLSESCRTTSETKSSEEKGFFFLLPDLNMAPTEEEEDGTTLYGTS